MQKWEIRKPRVVEIEKRIKAVVEAETQLHWREPEENSDEAKLSKKATRSGRWIFGFW